MYVKSQDVALSNTHFCYGEAKIPSFFVCWRRCSC